MNKKGQYHERPSYNGLSPVFIIGIVVFILPFVVPVFGFNDIPTIMKSICSGIGVIIILIGGALSIFNASN